jgi:transcription antitermination protein NusB
MSVRREGREAAVQFLYSLDQNPAPNASELDLFWSIHQAGTAAKAFAEKLVRGLLPRLGEIDQTIKGALEHWDFARLEVVDRNILRLAVYEMFHCFDTPPIVAINEAIEIAKRLGTTDSNRFINGILDRLKNDLKRPLRTVGGANLVAGGDVVAGVCDAGPGSRAVDQSSAN